jgi:hypothetical protein
MSSMICRMFGGWPAATRQRCCISSKSQLRRINGPNGGLRATAYKSLQTQMLFERLAAHTAFSCTKTTIQSACTWQRRDDDSRQVDQREVPQQRPVDHECERAVLDGLAGAGNGVCSRRHRVRKVGVGQVLLLDVHLRRMRCASCQQYSDHSLSVCRHDGLHAHIRSAVHARIRTLNPKSHRVCVCGHAGPSVIVSQLRVAAVCKST